MKNKSLEAILEKAIRNEEGAFRFYMDLYNTVEDKVAKNTLVFLADEEKKHRDYLIKYRDGVYPENAMTVSEETTAKIKEFTGEHDIKKNSQPKDIYLVAADRELNAYNFYKKLADIHPSGQVRELLLRMAQEELKHKEKMEYLYDNTAFPQTAGG
ncbi:MAG: ferritin family protein [Syntrophales bacterium]|jgi:rubrerythrin|nr:ferritin family protein [Syntrophales bacterium]MCK9391978.1 ferritin family protein [Syntrophales bacterium]